MAQTDGGSGSSNAGASGGLFAPPLAPALNHLLRRASWARERLASHAGKTVRFDVAPFAFTLEILANGEVAAGNGEAAATFKLTPALVMRMAAGGPETSGDLALARDIHHVAQNLRWDAEEDLSHVFGDIVAHRLAGAGAAFLNWQRDAAGSLARQAAAYWTEERPLLAARPGIEQFSRDVDTLRDDAARFEKRLEQLERRE